MNNLEIKIQDCYVFYIVPYNYRNHHMKIGIDIQKHLKNYYLHDIFKYVSEFCYS